MPICTICLRRQRYAIEDPDEQWSEWRDRSKDDETAGFDGSGYNEQPELVYGATVSDGKVK